jgi:curved DNA-binding protein CbpA
VPGANLSLVMTDRPSLDLYAILKVRPTADAATMRAAYRSQAYLRHPDRGGSQAAMTELNLAYAVLRDPTRRAAYDRDRESRERRERKPHWTGAAGPPPGRPSGPVLDFGLFAGWSLGEIARRDPGYLAWLAERTEGAPYLEAIEKLIAPMREAARHRTTRRP